MSPCCFTASSQPPAASPNVHRDIGIYGGDLYGTGNATSFAGISRIDTAIPTASGPRTSLVMPSGPNTFGFVCTINKNLIAVRGAWLLAASVFWLRDSGDQISPAVERARAAVQNT